MFILGYPTTKTCFLTLLFLYLPIDAPVHGRACSFSYFYLDCPLNVSIALHVHRYSRSSVCLLSLILPFRHNFMHNYPSTRLLGYIHTDVPGKKNLPDYFHASPPSERCMSTFVPVHQYTCSVDFFFIGITCTVTFQLIYSGTYTQIYLPVCLHASLSSNHKDLPVTTTISIPPHRCTRS